MVIYTLKAVSTGSGKRLRMGACGKSEERWWSLLISFICQHWSCLAWKISFFGWLGRLRKGAHTLLAIWQCGSLPTSLWPFHDASGCNAQGIVCFWKRCCCWWSEGRLYCTCSLVSSGGHIFGRGWVQCWHRADLFCRRLPREGITPQNCQRPGFLPLVCTSGWLRFRCWPDLDTTSCFWRWHPLTVPSVCFFAWFCAGRSFSNIWWTIYRLCSAWVQICCDSPIFCRLSSLSFLWCLRSERLTLAVPRMWARSKYGWSPSDRWNGKLPLGLLARTVLLSCGVRDKQLASLLKYRRAKDHCLPWVVAWVSLKIRCGCASCCTFLCTSWWRAHSPHFFPSDGT